MNPNIWHAEKYVPLLMTYGFTLHIIRVAIYFREGTANLSQIILPLVDLPLAIMMAYCALAMIFAWRQFLKYMKCPQHGAKLSIG